MTVDIATLAIRIDSQEAREAVRDMDRLSGATKRASQQSEALGGVMRNLAAVFATLKIVDAAEALVTSQREFDKLNASLITATGSVKNAAQAFGALQSFAASTPFGLAEVTKAFIQLRNLGMTPSERALTSYGNTASAMGKSLNQMVEAVADAATGEFERLKEFGIKAKQNGDVVSLTFQGVTSNIKNNAASIEKYLIGLGETKFAGGMELQAKTLDGAISNLGDAWDGFKRTLSQSGFGDAVHAGVLKLNDALGVLTEQVKNGGPIIEGLKASAKVAAAYFALFVAAPIAISEASGALAILYGVVGTGIARTIGATTATQALNTALFGTSVSAQIASGALTKLQASASVLFALFSGWQIGTYLSEQFVDVRIAGLAFVGQMLKGWELVKYSAELAWAGVTFSWNKSINTMKGVFADYLSGVAKGLSLVGATDTSKSVSEYVGQLRNAANSQKTFSEETAGLTAAHEKQLDFIDKNITELVQYELKTQQAASTTKKVAGDQLAQHGVVQTASGKTTEALKKEAEAYAALLSKINGKDAGQDADFQKNIALLKSGYDAGKQSLSEYVATVEAYIKQQKSSIDIEEARTSAIEESNRRAAAGAAAFTAMQKAHEDQVEKSIKSANEEADKNEELVATFGMTKAAVEQLGLARLEEQLAQRSSTGMTAEEIAALEQLIDAKRRSADAAGKFEDLAAWKKVIDDRVADAKRLGESIESSITDGLMRGFESGKGFGKNLVDTIKNMFNTLILRPVISAIINPVAGAIAGTVGASGAANAAGSAGGSMLGGAGGALLGVGGLTGSVMAGAGWLTGATTLSGSLTAAGSLFATGSMAGSIAGAGMVVGALAPIALGIAAAVAIWKKMDTSGTIHTGGAASASASGVTNIGAGSLGFQNINTTEAANKLTAQLATSIVSILDSTATTFGKTAGYTAATAFADDTSKDGAWGALIISNLNGLVSQWGDSSSRWAPKVFADGEAGQKEYLALLSSSVRDALDGIGLPAWAKDMLNTLGDAPALEDLAKVVEAINSAQAALVLMGQRLKGFAGLTDDAVSGLINASGGMDKLAANASAFYDSFYTDGEKVAVVSKQVSDALKAVGLEMPETRDQYRAMVEYELALGAAGATAAAALLANAAAYAKVVPAIESSTNSIESAKSALAEAYSAESDAIKSTIASTQDYVKTLMGLRDSMLIGSLSPLTPQEQYAEAARQYEATKAAAMGGDAIAQGNLSSAMTAYLTASRTVNASSDKYKADFARTQADLAIAIAAGKTQLSTADASLVALNKQVSGLMTVNESVLSVSAAIKQLADVMGASGKATATQSNSEAITSLYRNLLGRDPEAAGLQFWTAAANNGRSISDISNDITQSPEYKALHGSHLNGLSYVPFNGYRAELHEGEGVLTASENLNYRTMGTGANAALVAEIKALRTEVSELRSDQAKQTTALITSNIQATAQAAEKVADATVSSADSLAWTAKTTPKVI